MRVGGVETVYFLRFNKELLEEELYQAGPDIRTSNYWLV